MSGSIPREFIKELLMRVDIVDLIDSHVPLKKSGSNFVARCPFHNEKTPSFSVSQKKQLYHCFGCGAGGDAINFLMEFSHLDFIEAVEDLASFAGLDVPRDTLNLSTSGRRQDVSTIYEVLAQVATFYKEQLRSNKAGKKAIAYLQSRGVNGEIARDFALGYAPDSWDALMQRFTRQQLLDAGLVVTNQTGKAYDRFRGRLMFPIRDKRNRVIGFGGRVLDDSSPKYLNSPETVVFSKGREVYGLYELLKKNSKPQRIIIVEGYMDVIALAQFGIYNAVATLGTATSEAHFDLLFRFSPELILCFDGDKAGRQAAWRAIEAAFSYLRDGREIKVAWLPEGQDPDSLMRTKGTEGFASLMDASQVLSDYFFAHLSDGIELASLEGRARLLKEAKPRLDKIPAGFFREMMFSRLQDLCGASNLDDLQNKATLYPKVDKSTRRDNQKLTPLRVVIALLLQNPNLVTVIENGNQDWNMVEFPGKELLQDILQTISVEHPDNTAILIEAFRESRWSKEVRLLASLTVVPENSDEFDEVAELKGAFERVEKMAREHYLDYLWDKKSKNGLTMQENEVLNKLLSSNRG